ncbi:MAG: cupin domain-containing protein [Armatimonadaceae bacterium]
MSVQDLPLTVINRNEVTAFTTKDGSTIREILAPRNAPGIIQNQSLAEAILAPNTATEPHYHPRTEEIYYILQGVGQMRIGAKMLRVGPGDGIAIPPGAPHQITNVGTTDLVFLCCCAPAYTHDDTIMVELPEPQHDEGRI